MSTTKQLVHRHTGIVKMGDCRRNDGPPSLTAILCPRHFTVFQLQRYIEEYALGPNGQYERAEVRGSIALELDRTLTGVRTRDEMLHHACVFANDLEACFPAIRFEVA